MELNIRTSKKGTRVISATALHQALGLLDHHFQANVRQWLKDVYQFSDGIRSPEGMKDYARGKKPQNGLFQDYYFTLEFARLVALSTRSRVKQAVATRLSKEENVYPDRVQLTPEQTIELLELTRAMARISCQLIAEERHVAHYIRRTGSKDYWNRFRAREVVGTTMDALRERLAEEGMVAPAQSKLRDLIVRVDEKDCIRIGVVDHYAAQGHALPYCREMGQLARDFADRMQLEVYDDRQGEDLFAPPANPDVLRRLQAA